jgi:hypothetical protein
MLATTIIRTARPVMFATIVAASGIGLAPFVIDAPALAQQGGGGRGGDGGASGSGGQGGGSAANSDVYAVINEDAARRGGNCLAAPCGNPTPPRPPRAAYASRTTQDICGSRGAVRIVYDVNGDPLRYSCMPTR